MAKSIHDMAVDYGHRHCGCCNIEDFEAGANAVLEKIEKYLDDEDCVSRILSNYDDIKEIVLELKGE